MKILYLAGPGDVIGTYRHWSEGRDDPSQVSVTYSALFFELCVKVGAKAKVISYHKQRDRLINDQFDIEHRPVRLQNWRGPVFHLGWYWFNLSVVFSAILNRCDVIVLMMGTHLPFYWLARLAGIRVILTLQSVIWPKTVRPSRMWRLVHWVDRSFYRRGVSAIILNSDDIRMQVDELTAGRHAPIIEFRPYYRRSTFADLVVAENSGDGPFRILFAGRIEKNKGVLDLVRIATLTRERSTRRLLFDIAGDGSAMATLRSSIDNANLSDTFCLHGYCEKSRMRKLLRSAHAVIIPTTGEMIEGFNKVVAEAVLSHRPFITSHLSGALNAVGGAGIEVPPEDIEGYAQAIERLANDPHFYQKLVHASYELAEQFLDPERNWATALIRCLNLDQSVVVHPASCEEAS